MNYIPEIANVLGVEIGEEFSIGNAGFIYKFDDSGLLMKSYTPDVLWLYNDNMLRCLLNGRCTLNKFKGWSGENIKTIEIKYELKDVEK